MPSNHKTYRTGKWLFPVLALATFATTQNLNATCFLLPTSRGIFGSLHQVLGDTLWGNQVPNAAWPGPDGTMQPFYGGGITYSASPAYIVGIDPALNLSHLKAPAVVMLNPWLGTGRPSLPGGMSAPQQLTVDFVGPNGQTYSVTLSNPASGTAQGITLIGDTVVIVNLTSQWAHLSDPGPPAPAPDPNAYAATGNSAGPGNAGWWLLSVASTTSLGWTPVSVSTPDVYDEYKQNYMYTTDNMPFSTVAFANLPILQTPKMTGTISVPNHATAGDMVPINWSITFN
jgi:hypothetical protein